MKIFRIMMSSLLVLLALLMSAKPALAAPPTPDFTMTFSYSCTNNNSGDVAGSIGQFSVELADLGNNQAAFTFYNVGSYQSSITDVYFDDGVLLGIATIENGPGTQFSQGANPIDLPGGNGCTPPFDVTAGFLADSDPGPGGGTQAHGVNNTSTPYEYVTIVFDLIAGTTYADLVGQLNSGFVRIGIHVQGYASGGSESFVTDRGTAIQLDAFNASASRGKVTLNWATGTEIANAGFNLYRSTSISGPLVRANIALISAQDGAVNGASYALIDTPGYGTFYYWLEDVSTDGAITLHGPIKVTLAPAFRAPVYRPALPGN